MLYNSNYLRFRLGLTLSRRLKHTDNLQTVRDIPKQVGKVKIPDESVEVPKKFAFQAISRLQSKEDAIYTIQEAAENEDTGHFTVYFKYPKLTARDSEREYALRSVDNEYTVINQFPTATDFLIVGSGLVGSAVAYYTKKTMTRIADVLVLDKEPYSSSSCTGLSTGLISVQSKCRDISRIANLTKELIRDLANDIIVTPEDLKQIKYRPCMHLILWQDHEVSEAIKSIDNQIEDGQCVEAKLPGELEKTFPWLKVSDTDVVMGSHGCQDEALIDPIGLRNLYRTLAQAYGANFVVGEVIDFNTCYQNYSNCVTPISTGCVVARNPITGELMNVGANKILLSLGHNTPFLEARSELEPRERDMIGDLHFLQPKLRVQFIFQSRNAPVINFPAITDTDGSLLINESYSGIFKYCLPYRYCEDIFGSGVQTMDFESENPYPTLFRNEKYFHDYFNNQIKPRLVKRIPSMTDAQLKYAITGFESCNTHDMCPIISPHVYHQKVLISGGYGPRTALFGPSSGLSISNLMIQGEEEDFDMTGFYWNRRFTGRRIQEFDKLVS